ncbi:peptidoglycan DD-metalloendopeptidase family protein [Rhizobium redzepovicii]|uniref:Peptidoglycan DD-metalloendopeptidase family protein n=1 Tax=Rhizobium redzepovicii TaxID=2867518 RepID=A0AAW8NWT2_9HYPH|nr:peptidoglycan DD-metalloendopeptidase family protein [Rhizobium redzepovicii]MDR9759348.1 peptidoglycan DD-metalloendopeptidase family protein [Rhizobium redzepovicii]
MRYFSAFSLAILWSLILSSAGQADDFKYYPPGELFPGSGSGRKLDRQLYAPNIAFPLLVGSANGDAHAYAGSQINNVRGGSANAPENYVYPWRDVYCETRSWTMPLCPSGKGHQGVDIRPSSNRNDYWKAVAIDDGVVTSVTSNTTVTVRSDNGFYCRYLHMAKGSISDNGIVAGTRVRKGVTVLGRVSNIMGGIANTSIHLHFDCNKRVSNDAVFVPVYTSLISAYRKSMDLPNIDMGQSLGTDAQREVGSSEPGDDGHPTETCGPTSDIGTAAQFTFSSIWKHNCSVVGLVAQGNSRKFVYIQPRTGIKPLVQSDPILFTGTFENGKYAGQAKVYSSVCGSQSFAVEGTVSSDFRSVVLIGQQPVRDDQCVTTGTRTVELPFSYDRQSLQAVAEPNATDEPVLASLGAPAASSQPAVLDLLFRNVLNRSFPLMTAKWLTHSVPVCWENPDAASDADLALIKSAATDSWDKASRLDFTGWQPCVPGNEGIRIWIGDEGPHTKGLGIEINKVEHGMVLNTSFKTWGQACLVSEAQRKSCIYSITVHEFGHAIGFAHEQNRPDKPGDCLKPAQGTDGDTLLTPYDPSSVMNYCNSVYNNDGRLSQLDIYSVQTLYGVN